MIASINRERFHDAEILYPLLESTCRPSPCPRGQCCRYSCESLYSTVVMASCSAQQVVREGQLTIQNSHERNIARYITRYVTVPRTVSVLFLVELSIVHSLYLSEAEASSIWHGMMRELI